MRYRGVLFIGPFSVATRDAATFAQLKSASLRRGRYG